jgi:hypothetical protein
MGVRRHSVLEERRLGNSKYYINQYVKWTNTLAALARCDDEKCFLC